MLTRKRVQELLDYEPATGIFRWKVRRRSYKAKAVPGAVAGARRKDGYMEIRVDGELIHAHRLAFLWMTGVVPKEVDHKNSIRGDDRWDNLRPATHSQNGVHKDANKNNKLGIKGVRVNKGKYEARIWKNGRSIQIGRYRSAEEASAAYISASRKQHGEFSYASSR